MRSHSLLYYSNTLKDDLKDNIKSARITNNRRLLIQIFYGSRSEEQLTKVIEELRSLLPDCKIIGCSSTGEVHSSQLVDNVIVINFMQFDRASIQVHSIKFPDTPNNDYQEIGKLFGLSFNQNDPRLLLCYAADPKLNAEEFARGLVSSSTDVTLAGAVAGTNEHADDDLVICNNKIFKRGAVVAAIYGDELQTSLHHSPDWMMLGTPMKVTESRGNELISINNKPAADIFKRYLGDEVTHNPGQLLDQFPLITERDGRIVAHVCRSPVNANGHMRFLGNLETGQTVRFGMSDPVSAMDSAKDVVEFLGNAHPEAVLYFGSNARKLSMNDLTRDEIRLLNSALQTSGFLSAGQFFYTPNQPDYLHYSRTILTISEGKQAQLHLTSSRELREYSDQTRQLRAFSHLVSVANKDQEESLAEQERLANTDLLTDLYNRRKIMDLLESEVQRAQRYGRGFSIILFDIDDFKDINDQHGHQAGDQVLTQLGHLIREQARDTDLCARWGGEEFLIICPETSVEGAYKIADRIRVATERTQLIPDQQLTVSMGVTEFTPEDSVDDLLHRADKGLYHAKGEGKNQITIWN